MPRFLPLAMVQAPPRANTEESLGALKEEVEEMMADLPNVILAIYPENHLCMTRGTPKERAKMLHAAAEPLDGPRGQTLAAIARDCGIWLMPGTVCERAEDGALYCTAPVYSPEGKRVAAHRKCFPWRPFEPYKPGGQFTVFDIPDVGRIGIAICYDIWYPEVVRHLAWMGAEVVINPALTSTCDRTQELVMVRANALFNQVYMVSVNASEPVGKGRSVIADPEGYVRAESPSESPMVLTDVLNLDEVSRVRQFGTCGLSRPWQQFRKEDEPLPLPLYQGQIDPGRWAPADPSAGEKKG